MARYKERVGGEFDDAGPALKALNTDKQRRAVVHVEMGMAHGAATEACRRAGYTDGPGLNRTAHTLFRRSDIQNAVQELVRGNFKLQTAFARRRLLEIASTPGHKDEFHAVKAILDRGGIGEQHEVHQTVEHTVAPDTLTRLASMADSMGIPREKLLGWRQSQLLEHHKVIDVTPTVVPDEEAPATDAEPFAAAYDASAPAPASEWLEQNLRGLMPDEDC